MKKVTVLIFILTIQTFDTLISCGLPLLHPTRMLQKRQIFKIILKDQEIYVFVIGKCYQKHKYIPKVG